MVAGAALMTLAACGGGSEDPGPADTAMVGLPGPPPGFTVESVNLREAGSTSLLTFRDQSRARVLGVLVDRRPADDEWRLDPPSTTVRGHPALLFPFPFNASLEALAWEERDGVVIAVLGAGLAAEELQSVAEQLVVSAEGEVTDVPGRPDGLEPVFEVEDAGLVSVGFGGARAGSGYSATYSGAAGLFTVHAYPAPPEFLDVNRFLRAPLRDVMVGRLPALVAEPPDPAAGFRSLAWRTDDGTGVLISSEGLTTEEVIAIAEEVEPLTSEEWDRLRQQAR